MVHTDEWRAYGRPADPGRGHATTTHDPGHREWARDDDGDGIREVRDNTLEGIWTGLRSDLRTFREVGLAGVLAWLSFGCAWPRRMAGAGAGTTVAETARIEFANLVGIVAVSWAGDGR